MTKHSNKKRSQRRHPKHPKMMGGGVAENAIAVYGGIGQQHAAQGNVIAMNPVGGSVATTVVPVQSGGGIADSATLLSASPALIAPIGGATQHMQPMHGGNQLEQQQEVDEIQAGQAGGKTVIADLLVPAGLLYASQRMLKRSMKKKGGKKGGKKSRRNKSSRRRH